MPEKDLKYAIKIKADTCLYSSDDGNTIAVGLENGAVYLFDISHNVIISGESKELHRLEGLGKVVDIVLKNGKIS